MPLPKTENVPVSSLLTANQRVGNYVVVRKIGAGGMGEVWEAGHAEIGSRAAIKVLLPRYSHEPDVAERFFNEARAVNLIGHPGLVKIFDYGQLPSGSYYIAMEYLEGETLSQRIERRGRLGVDALRIARQTASALAATHAKGIVHRDLKPDNLFLVADPEAAGGERIKILDFGIAKLGRKVDSDRAAPARTAPEALMGTPQYMSPEQCRGAGGVDEKSDVYSLGIILYEMLAGGPLFAADTPVGEIMALHMNGQPPSLREHDPTITEELAGLVDSMLSKAPKDRPTMQEVAAALEDLGAPKATGPMQRISWGPGSKIAGTTLGGSSGQPSSGYRRQRPRAQKRSIVLVACGALGVVALVAVLLLRHEKPQPPPKPTPSPVPNPAPITVVSPPKPPETADPKPAVVLSAPSPKVHWLISSKPLGADVFDPATGTVLGTTPWKTDRPVAETTIRLRLRLKGYQDRELQVDQGHDQDILERLARKGQPSSSSSLPPGWTLDPDGVPIPPSHVRSGSARAD